MKYDHGQSKEIDLDSTDRLPILEGISIEEEADEDSIRIDYAAASQSSSPSVIASSSAAPDFSRAGGLDLPSLADSVRSVEERIARQSADYEALNKLYEKARDAQLAAGTRADVLAGELSVSQSALAVEQHRVREMERLLADTVAASEGARVRAEDSLRESERSQTEARTLRDSLTARDATIAQVLHSLGERDAQLHALQREHAKVVPALESRSQAGVRLEAELKTARSQAESLSSDLKASRESLAALSVKLSREESELLANRRDLSGVQALADSYLETLRSREWRSGFNQNLFRDWDEKMDAAQSGRGALQAESERLRQSCATLTAKLAEHEATMAKLHALASTDAEELAKKTQELQSGERARAELNTRINALDAECKRLEGELGIRSVELGEARTNATSEMQRVKDSLAALETKYAQQTEQIEQLKAEAITHEEEVTVLMAHLNEARRPVQLIQADIKRLNDELALKALSIDQLNEDNRGLRGNLERTRGALEERELLIRRLERSASNNANALGRLQTSMERLGAAPVSAPAPTPAAEFVAELVRLDGDTHTTYPLARRTRIGRAPGCELQIDSQSVSRNHAMLLKGPRELIVEDLNSTNGVLVNGRKISRHLLSDGEVLTIGETQFRCVLKLQGRATDAPTEGTPSVHAAAPAPSPPPDGRPADGPNPALAAAPPEPSEPGTPEAGPTKAD